MIVFLKLWIIRNFFLVNWIYFTTKIVTSRHISIFLIAIFLKKVILLIFSILFTLIHFKKYMCTLLLNMPQLLHSIWFYLPDNLEGSLAVPCGLSTVFISSTTSCCISLSTSQTLGPPSPILPTPLSCKSTSSTLK